MMGNINKNNIQNTHTHTHTLTHTQTHTHKKGISRGVLQGRYLGGRRALTCVTGTEGSPEPFYASRMRENVKVWERFPLDFEVDQLILKIVQLEFAKTLSPLDIVDRCLHWRKLERRKSVRHWEDILQLSCERLRVSPPKHLSRPYLPSSKLPNEADLAKMQANVEGKRLDIGIIGKRNSQFQRKGSSSDGKPQTRKKKRKRSRSQKSSDSSLPSEKGRASRRVVSNGKKKTRKKSNSMKKTKQAGKRNNSKRKSSDAAGDANLVCNKCGKHYHSENIGRIPGLINSVDTWNCIDCASENELNFGTCFVCGKGGKLVCCENCPRSFHSKCSGVLCGLEKSSSKKVDSSVNSNNTDWCKLCKATCPAKDNDVDAIDIFSVTTSMRYESERNLIQERIRLGDQVHVHEILRHLELVSSAHFFEELFFEYYEIYNDTSNNNLQSSFKMMAKFAEMIGIETFLTVLKLLKVNGTQYANGFSIMGGRGHGWQMCINCNKFRVLRTKCIHCGLSYRKDVVQPKSNCCEKFLFVPAMPKQIKLLINVLIPTREKSTFALEKKKSIGRALDRLMEVTMEKVEAGNRTKPPSANIPDLGSIVFLHYQAYVNLKDRALKQYARKNFLKAATMWLDSPMVFLREDDEQFGEEHEESVARIAAVLLDCTQGLCALRWAMTANIIFPCSKHGEQCPFRTLSISKNSRPYEFANLDCPEVSACPYERALQLEYNLSMIDEGELYNDSTTWKHDDRYPITQKGHCMRCDKKYLKAKPSGHICCDDKPLLRTLDYSTCYDYLIWGYCTQVIGIDAFKFDLSRFVRKLPTIRSYGTFEELGHRMYLHQCYFITHFIYVMSDWGRHRLCLNKFWEEFAFIVDNIKIVANHIKDFEVLGEFLNCLGIIGVAEDGEDAIVELVQYGQACLLQAERVQFKRNGQWVSRKRALKDQFHSSWCGLVGLEDYPPRAVGNIQRKQTNALRIPPYFLGLNASVSLFGLPVSQRDDRTPIKYELRHVEDKKYADNFMRIQQQRINGQFMPELPCIGGNNGSGGSVSISQDADCASRSDTPSLLNGSLSQFDATNSNPMLMTRRGGGSSVGSSLRFIDNNERRGMAESLTGDDISLNGDDGGVIDDIINGRVSPNSVESGDEMDVENEVGSDDSLTMMNTIGNVDVVDDDSENDNGHIVDVRDGENEDSKAVLTSTMISSSETTTRKIFADNGGTSPSNSSKSSTSYSSSSEER